MGRAGRRKRARRRAAAPPKSERETAVGAARAGAAGRWPVAAAAVAAALALGWALYVGLWRPSAEERPGENAEAGSAATEGASPPAAPTGSRSASPALPDPDTTPMTPPVARALRAAREAALARPGSAAATGRFCELLHAHWLLDEAAACYERARGLEPATFRWTYLLAAVEELRGAAGERVEGLFREAVRIRPEHAPATVRLADALLRLGRWSEARALYAEAAELDPRLVFAHRGRGQAAIQLGEGTAAVASLERAARLAPEDRITQVALARAYALAGERERAAEAGARAQSLTTEASLPDQVFFEVQSQALDPESLRGRIQRGLRAGDLDAVLEALALLEESAGPGPRRQLAASAKRQANRLAFEGDYEAALEAFARAARIAPDDPEIEHNRGTVLLRQGDFAAAARHFERAIELNPRSADSLFNLGVALEGLGRAEEAIARFRAAVAIEPDHVAAGRLAELGVPPGR